MFLSRTVFFQESLLNGRIEPAGVVEGFTADIGASGDFCPKHIQADVTAFFFSLSDDNAPSPYLVSLSLFSITSFPQLIVVEQVAP